MIFAHQPPQDDITTLKRNKRLVKLTEILCQLPDSHMLLLNLYDNSNTDPKSQELLSQCVQITEKHIHIA